MLTKAEIDAVLDEVLGPMPMPKPKVVVSDGVPIRDAVVQVSPADPNSRHGTVETVTVHRRPDCYIPPDAVTDRWLADLETKVRDRQRRREVDPFGLGHWGPHDD